MFDSLGEKRIHTEKVLDLENVQRTNLLLVIDALSSNLLNVSKVLRHFLDSV
jgi:hypothetical protein